MTIDDHIKNTQGRGRDVHLFIDQFAWKFKYDHRIVLHHKQGVEWIVKQLGENARWIAEQHIKDDWDGKLPEAYNDRNFYRIEWACDEALFLKAERFAEKLFKER